MDYKRNRGGQSSPTKCIEGTIKKLTANKERGGWGGVSHNNISDLSGEISLS